VRRLIEYAYHAGPEWIDAIMALFDFRWCIKAGRVVGLYDDTVKHYDMQLRDALAAALRALPFKEIRVLPKHREVVNPSASKTVALRNLKCGEIQHPNFPNFPELSKM